MSIYKKLDEVCDFINGGAWSDKEYVVSGIPVLKVSNFKSSGFSIEDVSYLPESSLSKYEKNILKTGDLVIATVGSHPNMVNSAAGRCCTITDEVNGFLLNQNAVCVRTKDARILDQRYLTYLGRSFYFQHYIQSRGRGAANQMRIAIGAIKEYEIQLPDIQIQRCIADILLSYDDLIENNQKQIKLLEETAMRLYKEWFVKLRFPGYETVRITQGIPDGWSIQPISAHAKFFRGKSYSSKELSIKSDLLLINLKNIFPFGGYKRSAEKYFHGDYLDRHIVSAGDLIMSVTDMTQERRLVGYTAIVPKLDNKSIISMDLVKIEPIAINKYYLYSTFRYGDLSRKISQYANGVNVLHLKPEAINDINLIIPNNEIQEAFASFVEVLIRKMETLETECQRLAASRDKLLPKLMSGEIEV